MYYKVTTSYVPVGSKRISATCPDCGASNCLELTFYQKHIITDFSEKVTSKVSATLYCHNTNTEIPSVQWTDEIAAQFEIGKANLTLAPRRFKFTKWFYFWFIIFPTVLIGGIFGYVWYEGYTNKQLMEAVSAPTPNLKVKAMFSDHSENGNLNEHGFTWFLVEKMEADTIWLKPHKDMYMDQDFSFDLNDASFTNKTIKVSREAFKKKNIEGFRVGTERVKFSGSITEVEN